MDLDTLVSAIAEAEAKAVKGANKKKDKANSDTFRNHFVAVYRNKYGVGYASNSIVADRVAFKKLSEQFPHDDLIKMINLFVESYKTIKGVDIKAFPRPSVHGLAAFANSLHAMIADSEETEPQHDYEESDGFTF